MSMRFFGGGIGHRSTPHASQWFERRVREALGLKVEEGDNAEKEDELREDKDDDSEEGRAEAAGLEEPGFDDDETVGDQRDDSESEEWENEDQDDSEAHEDGIVYGDEEALGFAPL